VYAYQLAVVTDDALMGVSEVVRGDDLRTSTPRQLYLYRLLGYSPPRFYHVPLLVAPDGRRLSKRDRDLDLGALRQHATPEQIIGRLAYAAGLVPDAAPISASELIPDFVWEKVKRQETISIAPIFGTFY
jgi:glutamyl-tRNA synthetase